jgi:anti-sigma regulatory factor (Ser/Thr protein kinase)/putative methionine-R-sulfoxide reductase with GAF domain
MQEEPVEVRHGPVPRLGEGQVALEPEPLAEVLPSEPQQLAKLYRLNDPTLSELALDALLGEVLDRIEEILQVDTVAILLREGDELAATAARGLEAEVEQKVRIPMGQGFAGRIAARRTPIFIPDLDSAEVVNPILRDMGLRSLLGVPLVVEGELVGVLHVGSLTPREFTVSDAAVLQLAAGRVAPSIERARLFQALEKEHRAAVALQRSLLPESLPDLIGARAAARYLPARDEVGGDWYDVIPLRGGRVGIAIGDVAGHGVRAAALMAQLRAALRAYALEEHPPAIVLELLDRMLQSGDQTGMATVIFAILDPVTGGIELAGAGHPPAAIVRDDGAELLDALVQPPIGVRPYPSYEQVESKLEVGETLLLYTDGLIEVRGEPLTDGLERLCAAARGTTNPRILCARVLDLLAGSGDNEDDVAVVAVQREAPPQELRLQLPATPRQLAPVRQRLRLWLQAQGASEEECTAIVLAAGEACANAIEHAYGPARETFVVRARRNGPAVELMVSDHGRWREPRSTGRGRGLDIMQRTMEDVEVERGDLGTTVLMKRTLADPV